MQTFYEHRSEELSLSKRRCLEYGPHLHRHMELVIVLEGAPIAILNKEEKKCFTGDVLFKGHIGITDFFMGNKESNMVFYIT